MSIAIKISDKDNVKIQSLLQSLAPDLESYIWPDIPNPEKIKYALLWKHSGGIFKHLPNLEVVFSFGAGVDAILASDDQPNCPIVRFVDPSLISQMTEYIALNTLLHHRQILDYNALQQRKIWQDLTQCPASETRIGIMGLGTLGQDAAAKLKSLQFKISGWSNSPKYIECIDCYAGMTELDIFLAQTDILICLLPLTNQTRGILNLSLFEKLARHPQRQGPSLINAGRGALQVEQDILTALDRGILHSVSLDVFETEPLPQTSSLWSHPRVVITPHNAASTYPSNFVPYVLQQIQNYEKGLKLDNVVDMIRGY